MDNVLGLFENVKRSGKDGQYMAKCPAHDDRANSLAIKLTGDGRVMLHCFAGTCDINMICQSVGITIDDLFPDKKIDILKPAGKLYNPYAVVKTMGDEALLVAIAAIDMYNGKVPSKEDKERIMVAAMKLKEAYEYARK